MDPAPLRLVLLGDSLAHGTGAARPAEALGPRLAAALRADGTAVELHLLAVPGAVSASLGPQVQRAAGLRADLAVVVVGANDLTRMVPPDAAARSLAGAVTGLRAAGADVLAVPAPDLSGVPWVPPALRPVVRAASARLRHQQAAAASAAGARLADVAADVARAFAADPAMFCADRFHPSSEGYAVIAAALAPHVLAAARERREGTAA